METAAPSAKNTARAARVLVAIAASAGGLDALKAILSALPVDFPAAVLVVQHLLPSRPSQLAQILQWDAVLRVQPAEEGLIPMDGHVYIAVPDRHLVLQADGRMALSSAEPVNFSRPSADLLFASVAQRFRERAVAVVLTGYGHDGSAGVREIRRLGGYVLAQDTATARVPEMPRSAIATGDVDTILPLGDIPASLVRRVCIAGQSGEA